MLRPRTLERKRVREEARLKDLSGAFLVRIRIPDRRPQISWSYAGDGTDRPARVRRATGLRVADFTGDPSSLPRAQPAEVAPVV